MTLQTLENALTQLEAQFKGVVEQVKPEKPVIQHCNAIEVLGAMQLAKQLIALEKQELASPPGATGPII